MVSRSEARDESCPKKQAPSCIVTISRTAPSSSSLRDEEPKPRPPIDIEESKRRGDVVVPVSKSGKPVPYYRSAPITRLKHPLEENIFTSLLITLLAVSVAILCGVPVLVLTGALLILAIVLRYAALILEAVLTGCGLICFASYFPYSSAEEVPSFCPPDRLAFGNDVRWVGEKKGDKCESILHTLLVFEGSLEAAHLRSLVQNRVLQVETREGELSYPRLTQRLVPSLGGYRWTTDYDFDVANHIFNGPAGLESEAQVQTYLGNLLTESLPAHRPLWEIRLVQNYGNGRDTLAVLRVHQALADGMTLVRILAHSLADRHQLHIPQRPHFAGLTFGFNVLRSFIVGPLTLFLWLVMTSRDVNFFSKPLTLKPPSPSAYKQKNPPADKKPMTQLLRSNDRSRRGHHSHSSGLRKGKEGLNSAPLLGSSSPSPAGPKVKSPEHRVTAQRPGPVWRASWSAAISVPKVSRVKQIMRSSFNDVLLSAAGGSVRKYIQCQGIQYPNDLKVVIPVDLRNDIATPKTSNKLGCKVASILASVPAGIESAIPRLWATRHRLDEVKASADPVVAYGATTILMNLLPQSFGSSVLDSITNKASFQFCNLAGPTTTLVIGGYPLKGIYPFYPPSGKIRVAVTVFTYADQVHLTALAHRSLPNACNSLLVGMALEVDQLSRQLSHRRVPGESRRSTRNSSTTNSEITKPPTKQIHIKLQVVQEELQQLSHQLDHSDSLYVRPSGTDAYGRLPPGPSGQIELKSRLKCLKNEFSDLIGELRRRSSIVEGMTISFEDEEMEDEFRKPRKRALSVASVSRRNSLFAPPRHMLSSDSSNSFRSDEDEEGDDDLVTSSPSSDRGDRRPMYSPTMRQSSSPIRTTAV